MKSCHVTGGEQRVCPWCERVIPESGRGSYDVRMFTCLCPGGIVDIRVPITEPCTVEDSERCRVFGRNPLYYK